MYQINNDVLINILLNINDVDLLRYKSIDKQFMYVITKNVLWMCKYNIKNEKFSFHDHFYLKIKLTDIFCERKKIKPKFSFDKELFFDFYILSPETIFINEYDVLSTYTKNYLRFNEKTNPLIPFECKHIHYPIHVTNDKIILLNYSNKTKICYCIQTNTILHFSDQISNTCLFIDGYFYHIEFYILTIFDIDEQLISETDLKNYNEENKFIGIRIHDCICCLLFNHKVVSIDLKTDIMSEIILEELNLSTNSNNSWFDFCIVDNIYYFRIIDNKKIYLLSNYDDKHMIVYKNENVDCMSQYESFFKIDRFVAIGHFFCEGFINVYNIILYDTICHNFREFKITNLDLLCIMNGQRFNIKDNLIAFRDKHNLIYVFDL